MGAMKDKVAVFLAKRAIHYVRKDFETNSLKLIDFGLKHDKREVYQRMYKRLREGLTRPGNRWQEFFKAIVVETDENVLDKLILPFYNTVLVSYDRRTAAMEKYDCNIPWAILLDPTAACNLHCTGCWAAEYGKESSLSIDDIRKIIREGKELGTYVYLYTGGEPLMRRKDIITLCKENPDCLFLAFTNGTLCDDEFADQMREVGNLFLTFSIEGNEETTDSRRGQGTYQKVLDGMKRLKDRGCIFGASLCYTKVNADVIASDEYADFLLGLGVRYAWSFTFVPVGKGATSELMATPEQRKKMYDQIRKWRFQPGEVRPFITIDFFNDGEYVGGCVAGGKQYFHISANGDCEPCVFAHYSSVNIKNAHLLDALQSPIFMAYRQHQPFSDNMLRPCPVMDQPGAIKQMVHETGALPTDLANPEEVDELFDKAVGHAEAWKPVADEIADEHGFVKFHIRSVEMYKDVEAQRKRDFEEFK